MSAATVDGERARAVIALAVVGVLWSTAGALIMAVEWPPAAIWGLRSAIAALALGAIARPSLRGLTGAEWASAAALAITTGLFILANKWTTPANAILIQYAAPAWAAIMAAVFLREPARAIDGVTIVLALAGVALFFLDELSFAHQRGNAVALIAGVTFAANVVLLRHIARRPGGGSSSALRAMWLGQALAAVVALPWVVTAPALPATGWAAMLALGLVQQTATTLLYAWAIRRVTAVEGLLLPIVEPILSPVWVGLAFAVWPGPMALVGGAIVVAAVTLRGWVAARGG